MSDKYNEEITKAMRQDVAGRIDSIRKNRDEGRKAVVNKLIGEFNYEGAAFEGRRTYVVHNELMHLIEDMELGILPKDGGEKASDILQLLEKIKTVYGPVLETMAKNYGRDKKADDSTTDTGRDAQ